jgi:hypothetical protein
VYKVYIISLNDSGTGLHKKSAQQILPRTLHRCTHYGWEYKLFSAINGYSIQPSDWDTFELKPPKKLDSRPEKFGNLPGAQGCFLSHFILWNRCIELDVPIVILEDDAFVLAPLNEIGTDQDLLKLHHPRRSHQSSKLGTWAPGAFAYWLSPVGAKKLVGFAKVNGPGHADKLIGSNILNWDYLTPPIVKLGPRIGSSTQPNRYPYRNK